MTEVVFWGSAEVKAGNENQTVFPQSPSYQAEIMKKQVGKSVVILTTSSKETFFLISNSKYFKLLVGIELRVSKTLPYPPLQLCTGS